MYVYMYVCMYVWMDGWMDDWMDVFSDQIRYNNSKDSRSSPSKSQTEGYESKEKLL